jgi:hypothetical protein
MAKKYHSKYDEKFARRARGGQIHTQLTIDKSGQPTLNPHDFIYRAGSRFPVEKSFVRRRRSDEVTSGEI